MNYSEFTEKMKSYICGAVKTSLAKLGIFTEVKISSRLGRRGTEYIRVETTPFNTTPVIYKSIVVFGEGVVERVNSVEEEDKHATSDDGGVYTLNFNMQYSMEYFDGGYNGVNIGAIEFGIVDNTIFIRSFKI